MTTTPAERPTPRTVCIECGQSVDSEIQLAAANERCDDYDRRLAVALKMPSVNPEEVFNVIDGLESALAEAQRDGDAWRDFAIHQTWCQSCADAVSDCEIGSRLQGAAEALDAAFAKARDHIVAEVKRMGGKSTIISTNIELKRDGLPYANFRAPVDSGVAVYFTYKAKQMCFACDRYKAIEDNMHAISLTISALRGIARWGTGDMMESAFSGFAALPAPGQTQARGWREILEAAQGDSLDDVKTKYRKLSSIRHPDKGGSQDAMSELNWAWAQAQETFRASAP